MRGDSAGRRRAAVAAQRTQDALAAALLRHALLCRRLDKSSDALGAARAARAAAEAERALGLVDLGVGRAAGSGPTNARVCNGLSTAAIVLVMLLRPSRPPAAA